MKKSFLLILGILLLSLSTTTVLAVNNPAYVGFQLPCEDQVAQSCNAECAQADDQFQFVIDPVCYQSCYDLNVVACQPPQDDSDVPEFGLIAGGLASLGVIGFMLYKRR